MSWDVYDKQAEFSDLVGKTLVSVVDNGEGNLVFTCSDGSEYIQYHSQDCCESVYVDDICGDLDDICGSPVLVAEESSSCDRQEWEAKPEDEEYYYPESFTWTFYKIDTAKGGVTIRWYGSSNGYYSESVSFARTRDANT